MAEVEILYNKNRAKALMEQEGVDAVIATTSENVQYLTGLPLRTTNWNMQIYTILPKNENQKLAIIIPTNRLSVLSQKGIPDAHIYVYGTFYLLGSPDGRITKDMEVLVDLLEDRHIYQDALEALLAAISDLGLQNGAIAVDEMRMSPAILDQLKEKYAGKVQYGYKLLRQIRLVKTAPEIERLRKSAELNEAGEMLMINMIQEGVPERALAQAYREFAVQHDSITGMVAVGGGPRSSLPLIEDYFYDFAQGDLVRFDLCLQHNGYWADTGRTAVLGRPNDWQTKCFHAVYEGWKKALSMVKPGAVASDIFNETVKTVEKNGIDEFKRQHVGHAIGLEIYDDVVLGPTDHTVIEQNMVLNVEVPYYLLGQGGFQIEDTVVVTETGCEFLTGNERVLFIR